jgi:hypothetical protein
MTWSPCGAAAGDHAQVAVFEVVQQNGLAMLNVSQIFCKP